MIRVHSRTTMNSIVAATVSLIDRYVEVDGTGRRLVVGI
jgi:hypothetical protein